MYTLNCAATVLQNLPLSLGRPGPPSNALLIVPWAHPTYHPKRHPCRFAEFTLVHQGTSTDGRSDRENEHATPSRLRISRLRYIERRGLIMLNLSIRLMTSVLNVV